MIVNCQCGTKFNDKTVEYCPNCNFKKARDEEYRYNGEAEKNKPIWSYRREVLINQKKEIKSFRTNRKIIYERTTGKKIGGNCAL
jgi:sarcosine oxidase delta subunit